MFPCYMQRAAPNLRPETKVLDSADSSRDGLLSFEVLDSIVLLIRYIDQDGCLGAFGQVLSHRFGV